MSKIDEILRRFTRKTDLPKAPTGHRQERSQRSWVPASTPAKPGDTLHTPNGQGLKVLIVDDERVFVDTFAIILGKFGYQTASAYSGEEALDMIEELEPDFLLADIVMGGVNGVEVAIAVRQRWPDCAILLTTGSARNWWILESAKAAGYDFELIGRPFHPKELIARFEALRKRPSSS